MSELSDRTAAMGDVLRLELRDGKDSYKLDGNEMYLLSDGVRHVIEENKRLRDLIRRILVTIEVHTPKESDQ